jgi:hypothetical protein
MLPLPDLDALSTADLKRLVIKLLGKVGGLERRVDDQKAEIARLKGLKGKPQIKPSGLDAATPGERRARPRRRRGKAARASERVVREDRILHAEVPARSRLKGCQDCIVQDLEVRPRVVRFRRERWVTPDGRTVIAPLPPGLLGHFGPDLRRFVLLQYHQGQTTIPRLVDLLRLFGLAVSKRQVVRLLNEGEAFVAEASAPASSRSTGCLPACGPTRPTCCRCWSGSISRCTPTARRTTCVPASPGAGSAAAPARPPAEPAAMPSSA